MEKNQVIQMQMKKFGWKEGEGLGKNKQGLKEAIKLSIKNNKNGLGLDPSEEFVFHWWDHMFNKVANSIEIKDVGGEVVVSKYQDASEIDKISSKRPKITCAAKKLLYGRFVPSGTTVGGTDIIKTSYESSESDCEREQDKDGIDFSNISTLERAFEISGGRTAHTAARHGNNLSGKLKRLQEQESKESCSKKKAKNYQGKESNGRKNGCESNFQQDTQAADRNIFKVAKEDRKGIGKMGIGRATSSLNKSDEHSLSKGHVVAIDYSSVTNEDFTSSIVSSSPSLKRTQQVQEKKMKSNEGCKMKRKKRKKKKKKNALKNHSNEEM